MLAALLLKCKVNSVSSFDRKHYFYSDLPHGYQITQQRLPIAEGGEVSIPGSRVQVQRVQLEMDSGKMLHDRHAFASLVNLNRAGMPLIEIVSAPDMRDGIQASAYAKTVQQLLRHVRRVSVCKPCHQIFTVCVPQVGVCDGNMEDGSFRVDVNVSVHEAGQPWGARCEVKNLNSFKSISRAIDFESERQRSLLSRGAPVLSETRLFNAITGQTVKMRNKDSQWDYRFMPDPDLPAIHVLSMPAPASFSGFFHTLRCAGIGSVY